MILGRLVRVRKVTSLAGLNMRLEFKVKDGSQKVIDLKPFLHGPVFELIRDDPELFRAVKIEGGMIAWPNGADIDPDVLYYNLKPAWSNALTGNK